MALWGFVAGEHAPDYLDRLKTHLIQSVFADLAFQAAAELTFAAQLIQPTIAYQHC